MKATKCIIIVLIGLIGSTSYSQEKEKILSEINSQIWQPFSEAFENLDYPLFESIHHKDFLRVNGNNDYLKLKDDYLQQYKQNWQDKSRDIKIEFRFIERINSVSHASERGIYKMTVNPDSDNEQNYYGKFHVFIQKFDANWKLVIDYDSHEENTIGKEDFEAAFAIDDFEN